MSSKLFSSTRFFAVVKKEFIQMRRDRMTLAMMVVIPLVQLLLFGYAINVNPKHLPTAILSADHSAFTRALAVGLEHTRYFSIDPNIKTEQAAQTAIAAGNLQFVINIPPGFTRSLIRGEHPNILLTVDASDPGAAGSAISALQTLLQQIFTPLLNGPLNQLKPGLNPAGLIVHSQYNPRAITQYNIVPGLIGVILTMTLILSTALSITRERERSTMESLLAMPVTPLEVLLGKLTPYILLGYVAITLILVASKFLFAVPITGSIYLLYLCSLPFIMANLAVGLCFSTLAKNQLQASQMTMFFFLPSILLSGFMFPFHGMPTWAQHLGLLLPMTHYLKIVRGIMLKGNDFALVWLDLWPILIFLVGVLFLAVLRFRQTLD